MTAPNSNNDQEARINDLQRQIHELQRQAGITPKPSSSTTPSKKAGRGLTVFLILVFGSIPVFFYYGFRTGLEGSFSSEGSSLGTWTAKAEKCRSGAAYIPPFWGATIDSGQEPGPRIQVNADDKNLTLFVWKNESENPIFLNPSLCKTFNVDVQQNHSRVNNVIAVKGHVHVDCSIPGGGSFNADIEFKNCH